MKKMTIVIEVDMSSKEAKKWKHVEQFFDDQVSAVFEMMEESAWKDGHRKYESEYITDDNTKAMVTILNH